MRRSLSFLSLVVAGAALAACLDGGRLPAEPESGPLAIGPSAAVSFNQVADASGGVTFPVTIDPRRENVYGDGINAIRFPANSICDPATSSYGPGTWDSPCTPATSPITLPVTLAIADGRFVLHFGRNLRFAPSADPARHVTLVMASPAAASDLSADLTIFWQPDGSTARVNEAETDPSLATRVDRENGTLTRRLKHFSGYTVSLGRCPPETPSCRDASQPPPASQP